MKFIRLGLAGFVFIFALASASLAGGSAGRTFVSGKGLDTNPCTLASPCRTFAAAMAQTGSGGEVVVLDSAGYGPFSISQAVTITAPPGVYAGITAGNAPDDGIDINAGAADVVTLRGLTVNGPGAAVSTGFGVNFKGGAALHIEGCEVRGFDVDILSTPAAQTFIKDTVVKDAHFAGIELVLSVAGNSFAALDHVSANNCVTNGIFLQANAAGAALNAEVRNSTIAGNSAGVAVSGLNNGIALIDLEHCIVTNGNTGIETSSATGGLGAMSITSCLISHNNLQGFAISGGNIQSLGDNTIIGNGPNIGSLTSFAPQ